jgi:16S rRNA (guanine527-N7)-methyltransferase
LAVDLGTGGGVPGLVLACAWPGSSWVLVEAHRRRASFLEEAAAQLGCAGRVQVLAERAEVVGRAPAHRGAAPLVVARSFGPPGVTAECAAPLLAVGGALVVSEPPGGDGARWPVSGLARLGAVPERSVHSAKGTFQVIRQTTRCPDRYPRRVGVPAKRPLF